MRKKSSGTTLVEMLVASALLLLFFAGVFMLFQRGSAFLLALDRKGNLQSDFLALKAVIRSDFQRTDLGSVSSEPATEGRESASCLILSDWSQDDNFSVVRGGPKWDRRVVYHFRTDQANSLLRTVVQPEPDLLRPRPIEGLSSLAETSAVKSTELSDNVGKFDVETDVFRQHVLFQVTLEKGENAGVSGRFLFVPRNTGSRL